jgi:8-amino-7-oxononanoate synthase
MDGDVADVRRLLALADRFDAWLVLDDAHGIGVLGDGRGTPAHAGIRSPRVIHMATLGKALGGYGAFVAADPNVIEWLLQRARTYVFSTALPASVAAAATAAIGEIEREPGMVSRLHQRIAEFRDGCHQLGIATHSLTAIHPIVVGDPMRAVRLGERLRARGQLVPAIRPPTVPDGTARLRVSLSAAHTTDEVAHLAQALAECLAETPA